MPSAIMVCEPMSAPQMSFMAESAMLTAVPPQVTRLMVLALSAL